MTESNLKLLIPHLARFIPSAIYYRDMLFQPNNDELSQVLPYLCPLCLQQFISFKPEEIRASAKFNRDHFPPESAGGKDVVIVCEACNNSAGTIFDNTLVQKADWQAFSKGRPFSVIKTETVISNVPGRHRTTLGFDADGKMILSLKKENKRVPPIDQFIKSSGNNNDYEIKLTYNEPDIHKVRKALLKTAYLYCFNSWGYNFALSEAAANIRKVLAGEMEYPYADVAPFWIDDIPNIPEGLCFISNPLQWQSYVVNIPLISKNKAYKTIATVVIPAPTEDGWITVAKFKDIFLSAEKIDFSFTPLPNSINESYMEGYTQGWFELYKIQ